MLRRVTAVLLIVFGLLPGCQSAPRLEPADSRSVPTDVRVAPVDARIAPADSMAGSDLSRRATRRHGDSVGAAAQADPDRVQLVSLPQDPEAPVVTPVPDASEIPLPAGVPVPAEPVDQAAKTTATPIQLDDVIASVLATYPMVQSALIEFDVAGGQVLSANGAFDTRLKADSETGAVGFYETYRHSVGAVQPLAFGGEVFGGYRVGRGNFQPWYQERQTNAGGEFKAGLMVPLSRNVSIDDRRAGVRKAVIDYSRADPQFRGEVILTVQAAAEAYWQWVAAAAQAEIAEQVLALATTRNAGLEEEVRTGAQAPPVLKDNRRSILSREAKLIEANRKLAQSAAKLSLYLRTIDGEPRVPNASEAPAFPQPTAVHEAMRGWLIDQALQMRPELRDLELSIERIDVEIAESANDLLPNVNAVLAGSQDVGEPSSPKRDKSPFEIEASLFVDVPVQRRKARGKVAALEAKRSQVAQKRRLMVDKIRTEISVALAAVTAAFDRVERTAEARQLAEYMAGVEREKFEAGESDLLAVALREQYVAEAAGVAVEAQAEYQFGRAQLRAAIGIDDGSTLAWSPE